LETIDISEKLPFGPIISPKPGPTFEIEVAAADIEVKKSRPEKDKSKVIIKNIEIYKKMNEITDAINLLSIFFPLYLRIKIPLG
tara:strand:- start:15 stop:266 length:252 start_codon:yes stop_codon:yes gene_type:complete